ncbi:MAG: hypothetical protein C4523_14045 [Myxococcales bacterium]|nr:MAG: hypothetical protein C4523_14045 [Myxococcales bacterium]
MHFMGNARTVFMYAMLSLVVVGTLGCKIDINKPTTNSAFHEGASVEFSAEYNGWFDIKWKSSYIGTDGNTHELDNAFFESHAVATADKGYPWRFKIDDLPRGIHTITAYYSIDDASVKLVVGCNGLPTSACSLLTHGCVQGTCNAFDDICIGLPDHSACDNFDSACVSIGICRATDGECYSLPLGCDDDNACTEDTCVQGSGCVHTDISDNCKDDDLCTTDSCDPAWGCKYDPAITCDQANHEVCVDGECVCDTANGYQTLDDGTCSCADTSCVSKGAECDEIMVCGEPVDCGQCDAFSECVNNKCEVTDIPLEPIPNDVDPTVVADVCDLRKFLVENSDPVQRGEGLAELLENCDRILHVSGFIRNRNGEPLAGVRVTVKEHPEYGVGISRENGRYDMLLNGGGTFVLRFDKRDYIPMQRRVSSEWNRSVRLDDIYMTPRASSIPVNMGDFNTQLALGETVGDDDGQRTATLIFEPNTSGWIALADGTQVSLRNMSLHITEITVGENGPAAMPAPLPPATAYTYAVDFSIDEAEAAGDAPVQFDKPIALYVDNFLGFAVGGIAPVGYFDPTADAWIASKDGLVVKIHSCNSYGRATLDIDGSGTAASDEELEDLGVSDEERQALALGCDSGRFAEEGTYWRVEIEHFTPYDINWPQDPPDGATPPGETGDGGPGDDGNPNPEDDGKDDGEGDEDDEDKECKEEGSKIVCQSMTLGESIPIEGTPFKLHYQSNRTYGRKVARSLRIPVAGENPPSRDNLDGTRLFDKAMVEVSVAGRTINQEFAGPLSPKQEYYFTWDQFDEYGRFVNGIHSAVVRISYFYHANYSIPSGDSYHWSFGRPGSGTAAVATRDRLRLTDSFQTTLGVWDQRKGLGLGGWSLSPHHFFDEKNRILYLGDGTRRSLDEITISRYREACSVQGTFTASYDGSLYVSSYCQIAHVVPGETTEIIAGVHPQSCGESQGGYVPGSPAESTQIGEPRGMAVDKMGNLYFSSGNTVNYMPGGTPYGHCIRKVDSSSSRIITTHAGDCGPYGEGDEEGKPGRFNYPTGIATDEAGNVFVADTLNYKIKRVDPLGTVITVAGNGLPASNLCGNPTADATACNIGMPEFIAIDSQSNVYFSAVMPPAGPYDHGWRNGILWKLSRDGTLSVFAGGNRFTGEQPMSLECPTGFWGEAAESKPATQACLAPIQGMTVDWRDNVYISEMALPLLDSSYHHEYFVYGYNFDETTGGVVYRVGLNGSLKRIAGKYGQWIPNHTPYEIFGKDGQLAILAGINPGAMAYDGAGNLLLYDYDGCGMIHKITAAANVTATDEGVAVASKNGQEYYVFDDRGHHLKTYNALTNGLIYSFGYDAKGYLTSITDASIPNLSLNTTVINRNGELPQSIVAPAYFGGYTTSFELDEEGYITAITKPGENTYTFTYKHLNEEPDPEKGPRVDVEGLLATMQEPASSGQFTFDYDSQGRLTKDQDPVGGEKSLSLVEGYEDAEGNKFEYKVTLQTAVDTSTHRDTSYGAWYEKDEDGWFTGNYIRQVTHPSGLSSRMVSQETKDTIYHTDGTIAEFEYAPDPQWGYSNKYASNVTVTLPGDSPTDGDADSDDEQDPPIQMEITQNVVKATTEGHFNGGFVRKISKNGKVAFWKFDSNQRIHTYISPEKRAATVQVDEQGKPKNINLGLIATVQIDAEGNLISAQLSGEEDGLAPITVLYDAGRIMNITQTADMGGAAKLRGISISYSNGGTKYANPRTIGFLNGESYTLDYYSSGRLQSIERPDDYKTYFEYDANGNMTYLMAPPVGPSSPEELKHGIGYTEANLEASYTPPVVEQGVSTETTYGYYLDRQKKIEARPDNKRIDYTYDAAGRLDQLTATGMIYTYSYGSHPSLPSQINTADGISLKMEYIGSLLKKEDWSNSLGYIAGGTVKRSYNDDFLVSAYTVGNGNTVNQYYDNDGWLRRLSDTAGNDLNIARKAFGAVEAFSLTTDGNILMESLSYNAFGELERQEVSFNGDQILLRVYENETGTEEEKFFRDERGRIKTVVEMVAGSGLTATTYTYIYDNVGRLRATSIDDVSEMHQSTTRQTAYAYSPNGNRGVHVVSDGESIVVQESCLFDQQDRLTYCWDYGTTPATYKEWAFSKFGNLMSIMKGQDITSYSYDVFGNLRDVTLSDDTFIEYIIDGKNRRIGKKTYVSKEGSLVSVQGWLYKDQLNPVAELDGNGMIKSIFVYGTKPNVPDYMTKDGDTYRIISDHLGSVRLVVRMSDGVVVQRMRYSAFGEVLQDTNPGFQPFGFVGGLYDPQTGFVRFGARDYDPSTGRWTTKDPIRFDGGQENLYVYVNNDPINRRDLNGKDPITLLTVGAAITFGGNWLASHAFCQAACKKLSEAEKKATADINGERTGPDKNDHICDPGKKQNENMSNTYNDCLDECTMMAAEGVLDIPTTLALLIGQAIGAAASGIAGWAGSFF